VFAYIVRRLLSIPLVFIGVTLLVVLLLQLLSPQQRAAAFVTSDAQLRNLDAVIEQYGLDEPFHVQYVNWMREALTGNLGFSTASSEPVMTTIRKRFPASAELALVSLIPVIGLGIWLGTLAALNRDRAIDQITRVVAIIGWSLPNFVLGIWLLVIFYGGFGEVLREFAGGFFRVEPGRVSTAVSIEIASGTFPLRTRFLLIDSLLAGRPDVFWDALRHLVLPVITLAATSSALIMRVMRSSLLESLSQDYVRTARAKGLREREVTYKHARRTALIPVITLAGFTLIFLLNGVVITETVFNYPGLGRWFATAAVQLDYPAVMGFTVLTGLIVVIGNLLVDVLYAVIDPRIRLD
jgi:peptide/nickel transport system permease protein